ncbi:MAG: glycosyltransferase family A protein [Terricaulis sp.]
MRTEAVIAVRGGASSPTLSVVTPFHRDDPCALLAALAPAPTGVEFVLLDDGSGDAGLLARAVAACAHLEASARIVVWAENRGRSEARNRLIAEARGEYVLFMDADMKPDHPEFLRRWLRLIGERRPHAAFGGLSLRHATRARDNALHFDLFAHSDCRGAAARARSSAQYVSTANLLVRRDLLATLPFDSGFIGWGFEDVDWALRAAETAPIHHFDNTASHVGLDSPEALLRKSVQAGPNFARLFAKHPRAVSRFAAYRAARVLRWAPGRKHLLRAFAALALLRGTPMAMRRGALKLFRVLQYGDHLP